MSNVVALPLLQRSCFQCVHNDGGAVSRCQIFDEYIDSEIAAARDCPAYEEES